MNNYRISIQVDFHLEAEDEELAEVVRQTFEEELGEFRREAANVDRISVILDELPS